VTGCDTTGVMSLMTVFFMILSTIDRLHLCAHPAPRSILHSPPFSKEQAAAASVAAVQSGPVRVVNSDATRSQSRRHKEFHMGQSTGLL
jgi:hypothetical protein